MATGMSTSTDSRCHNGEKYHVLVHLTRYTIFFNGVRSGRFTRRRISEAAQASSEGVADTIAFAEGFPDTLAGAEYQPNTGALTGSNSGRFDRTGGL